MRNPGTITIVTSDPMLAKMYMDLSAKGAADRDALILNVLGSYWLLKSIASNEDGFPYEGRRFTIFLQEIFPL